jgi:transaldolase
MEGVEMDIKELEKCGQAIWLDYIRRDLLANGEFARLVKSGICGVTTNPSIFEKAIAESTEYDAAIDRLVRQKDEPAFSIYERLSVEDIQQAADILRSVYDATARRDGYISMEVSPHMAHDTAATLGEARRLWAKVRRLMIKVDTVPPATLEALRDHGKAESRLEQAIDEAGEVIAALTRMGISLDVTTEQLLADGVKAFSSAFDKLMASIEGKRQEVLARVANGQRAATV